MISCLISAGAVDVMFVCLTGVGGERGGLSVSKNTGIGGGVGGLSSSSKKEGTGGGVGGCSWASELPGSPSTAGCEGAGSRLSCGARGDEAGLGEP